MRIADSPKLKLGVLAPNSNFVPFLANDMLAAIKSGLAEARLEADLIIESAGYNADVKMLAPTIQQLILNKEVNCVIAPLNVSLIEKLAGNFESQRLPLIALNLTEDPLFETGRNPFVFVNSFYLWQSAWMSGYLAGQRFGPRGAATVPLHESGYGLMFAFQLGLEAAQGFLVKAVVTHRNSSTENPTESIKEVDEQSPDFIWAAYSGKEAGSFLAAYEASSLRNKIPLITIPTMISQNIRRMAGDTINEIWYVSAEHPVPDNATDLLSKTLGREPNPYALLAYEATQLVASAVCKGKAENLSEVLPGLLQQVQNQSRRGLIHFNNFSGNETFYLRQIKDGQDTTEEITAPALLKEQYILACRKLVKEGWVNPYLCA